MTLLLVLAACQKPPPLARLQPSPAPAPAASPATAKPTTAWRLTDPGGTTQGYASTTSAAPGDVVHLYVSSMAQYWNGAVYRMGWYGGQGGTLVETLPTEPGIDQGGSTHPDPATGLVRGDWKASTDLEVGVDWPSGMYMVKLTDSGGQQSYIPLVVRGRGIAPVVFVHSSATDEAYNRWGFNQSLYTGTTPNLHLDRAVAVSFDRPFQQDFGAGLFFYWEYQLVRLLERSGIAVDYLTDIDVHEHPDWLKGYRAVVIAGHDEYWSLPMRDAFTAAVGEGVNLAVFGGNTAYRQIRLEPSSVGPDRVEVCYKDAALDPEPEPSLKTAVAWRSPPTDWDEGALLGETWVGTGEEVHREPWVVADPASWVLAGTHLEKGDKLQGLVGYEQDSISSGAHPAGVDVISDSPVPTSGGTVVANSTVYTAPSGAIVFDAGTIEWSWGVDHFFAPMTQAGLRPYFGSDKRPDYYSPAAVTITLNVLRRMLGSKG
ncbi:MAG TPA: N,N-dimethylformamidase beta subunit family domain-containing protein [Candidatus Dormibacteraeota bacterium]